MLQTVIEAVQRAGRMIAERYPGGRWWAMRHSGRGAISRGFARLLGDEQPNPRRVVGRNAREW